MRLLRRLFRFPIGNVVFSPQCGCSDAPLFSRIIFFETGWKSLEEIYFESNYLNTFEVLVSDSSPVRRCLSLSLYIWSRAWFLNFVDVFQIYARNLPNKDYLKMFLILLSVLFKNTKSQKLILFPSIVIMTNVFVHRWSFIEQSLSEIISRRHANCCFDDLKSNVCTFCPILLSISCTTYYRCFVEGIPEMKKPPALSSSSSSPAPSFSSSSPAPFRGCSYPDLTQTIVSTLIIDAELILLWLE